jgi:hypothetical protein
MRVYSVFLEQLVLDLLFFKAIGFVLYGDTERLNKTDKRSYNMLNLKSDKNIEFEFLNFEERKFKFPIGSGSVLKKPHQ